MNLLPASLHIDADDVEQIQVKIYSSNQYHPAYTVRTLYDRRQRLYVTLIIESGALICFAAAQRGIETYWDVEDRARDMYREILAKRKMQREAA